MTREEATEEMPREDLMREALDYYEELATKACWYRNDIPKAIRAYYAPLSPAEGADPKKVQWSGYGGLGNIKQQPTVEGAEDKFRAILDEIQILIETMDGATDCQLKAIWNHLSDAITTSEQSQPPAEGAEEILTKEQFTDIVKRTCEDVWHGRRSLNPIKEQTELIVEKLYPFFTLHAQRIADKIVNERLREALMAYDKWLGLEKGWIDNYRIETAELSVDEFLESDYNSGIPPYFNFRENYGVED